MPNFRNVITDCIQSSRSGTRPDLHLTEAESTYNEATERLERIQNELKESEALYEQKRRYLKKLLLDEVAGKIEVPRLKKELLGLKEKLMSVTFETERWGKICHKQENQITTLQGKKNSLNQTLDATETTARALEEENRLLTMESKELACIIEDVTSIRTEIDLFKHIVPCGQPSAEAKKLSSAELVNAINTVVSKIRHAQTDKQQAEAKSVETSANVANLQNSIETTQENIKKLQEVSAGKEKIVASLDTNISALRQQIHELKEKYQTYADFIEESSTITEKRKSLIITENSENANLKESLLACNKLEMTLRLEELKMVVFLKEMEKLDE